MDSQSSIQRRSWAQVSKELRRRRPKEQVSETPGTQEDTPVDVKAADKLMQDLLSTVTNMELDLHHMKKDLEATDPDQLNDDDDEPEVQAQSDDTTLVQDLAALQTRLEETKARSQKKTGMGHIYLREGELQEVELHEGMDGGGEDDDLEDLIRKPKLKRPTPHRDCFNPLSKLSVHK